MRRRGSHSEKMLKPTIAVVQGQRQEGFYQGIRRHEQIMDGRFVAPQQPPQVPVPGAVAHAQNSVRWQNQQQQSSGRTAVRHHSFASSMDLMTPSNQTFGDNFKSSSQPLQSSLFKSSSHHTSHTAVAGDLLTMSRRALEAPPPNQNNFMAKKRSAPMVTDNTGHSNVSTNGAYPTLGQQQSNRASPQPRFCTPQHSDTMGQVGNLSSGPLYKPPFADQAASALPFPASYVSSSTIGSAGDSEEAYQHHRAVRRCRRSDSFEMMEDS
ncbi:hypothetical protein ACHAWF_001366 [Thalassiosira exigua]